MRKKLLFFTMPCLGFLLGASFYFIQSSKEEKVSMLNRAPAFVEDAGTANALNPDYRVGMGLGVAPPHKYNALNPAYRAGKRFRNRGTTYVIRRNDPLAAVLNSSRPSRPRVYTQREKENIIANRERDAFLPQSYSEWKKDDHVLGADDRLTQFLGTVRSKTP